VTEQDGTRKKKLRSKTPVSSFGPELLAVLMKGSVSRVEIPCPTSAVATKLVHRLYTLRKRLRDEGDPQAELIQRAKISNQVGGRHTSTIIIQPHDYEYRDILAAAGIDVELVKDNLLGSLATEDPSRVEGVLRAQEGENGPGESPSSAPLSPSPSLLASLLKEYK
jgi:hypothetical protein